MSAVGWSPMVICAVLLVEHPGPITVCARIGFTSISGHPGADLAADRTPRHTQQQGSSHLSLPFEG